MNFQDTWSSFHKGEVPIGFLLRPRHPDTWFRIHSLPESKRYAEDETEMQEILRRHSCVADAVLGKGADCILFFPDYAKRVSASAFAAFSGELFCRYKEDADITMLATRTRWQSGKFDDILRLVANDKVCYISWMNTQTGEMFAPYDGGADLFLNSTTRRDMLKSRFEDWLSKHPQGF